MKFSRKLRHSVLIVLVAVLPAHAEGPKVPALRDVPKALPDPARSDLRKRRENLAKIRDALRSKIQWHDDHCLTYWSNSPDAVTCPPLSAKLPDEKEAYIKAASDFNYELSQAVGYERIRLEDIISAMNKALENDAGAVRGLGFKRRAQDFAEWDKLSLDAHRKLWDALTSVLIDKGSEGLRDGIFKNLAKVGPEKTLAALEKAGLGGSEAAAKLRTLPTMSDKSAYSELATLLNNNIKANISMHAKEEEGQHLETLAELIELMAPETLKGFFMAEKAGEVVVWALYDASAYGVASHEVNILNKVTDAQLKALQSLKCVSERHSLTGYDAQVKLSKLCTEARALGIDCEYRDTPGTKPHQSGSCSRSN